ncbi:MAG: N-acetylmuramoyl-L-alanine amidase family protein [Candidatus Dormibacteria bacterium]
MRKGPSRLFYVTALALGTGAALAGPAAGIALAAARPKPPRAGVPPQPYVVAIMPGHGGYDPGAISPFNGLKEKNVTLSMGLDLRRDLEAESVRVVMTRTTNVDVTIAQAERVARQSHANALISLWVNDWTDSTLEGFTVFTPHAGDQRLANHLYQGLAQTLGPLGMGNRGTASLPQLWVHAPMPAVTIEVGFMSNQQDSQLLAQPSFRAAAAAGIARGMLSYAPQILTIKPRLLAYHRAQARARAQRLAAARHTASLRQLAGWAPPLLLADLLLFLVAYRGLWVVRLRRRPAAARPSLGPLSPWAGAATRSLRRATSGSAGRRAKPAVPGWLSRRAATERHRPPREWRGTAATVHPRRVTEMVQPRDRGRRGLYDDLSF